MTGAADRWFPPGAAAQGRRTIESGSWLDLMGDDGTGHCRGCGCTLDRINEDCEVCVRALCTFMDEEVDSNGEPF